MAAKKQSAGNAVNEFLSVMQRASLSNYQFVNQIMFSKTPAGKIVIIIPNSNLWLKLNENEEFKKTLTEVAPGEIDNQLIEFGSTMATDTWLAIDAEAVYQGKLIKIDANGRKHGLVINRDLLPLKLKKAECNDISYRITSDGNFLILKKNFHTTGTDCGFTIMRVFRIL